ncbi:MAG: hypothetical protein V4525_07780 [Pseudomonadota bacterium]
MKKKLLFGRHTFVFKCALLAIASSFTAAPASSAEAPTYDYDAATLGTQAPTSPLLSGYTYRSVRTYQVAIPVLVPLNQLQAILPPGFVPVAAPSNSNAGTVTLSLFLDQRFQPTAGGPTYGPTSALLMSTTAINYNLSTPRTELVFPMFEASSDIDMLNAAFGPGAARQANVKVKVEEDQGMLHFSFNIEDSAIGFKFEAEATGPAAINTRTISDPVGLPFRALNGFTANQAFRAASQSDTLTLPSTDAKVKIKAPGHYLQLKNGKLNILGIGANVTFSRNVEFIVKFE